MPAQDASVPDELLACNSDGGEAERLTQGIGPLELARTR
jgi:hypothetical protein